MAEPNNHEQAQEVAELKKQHAVLEERMNTSYERLRTDMAKRDNRLIYSVLVIMSGRHHDSRLYPDLDPHALTLGPSPNKPRAIIACRTGETNPSAPPPQSPNSQPGWRMRSGASGLPCCWLN